MARKKVIVPESFIVPEGFRVIDYPFHLGDLIGGTAHLSNAYFGAYVRILIALTAKHEGMGLAEMKAHARLGKHWPDFWGSICGKFTEEGGFFRNERVRQTVRHMAYVSFKNTDNALKGHNSQGANVLPSVGEGGTNLLTSKPYKKINKKYDVRIFIREDGITELNRLFPKRGIDTLINAFNRQVIESGERPVNPLQSIIEYIRNQE